MRWLSSHWHTMALVLRKIGRTPFSSLLTILVIGVTLSLPAGLYTLIHNVQGWAGGFHGGPKLTLFIARDAGHAAAQTVAKRLATTAGIRHYDYIPRDQALAALMKSTGWQDLTAGLTQNPLPDVFIIQPTDTTPATLENMRTAMQRWPGVALVQIDAAWAKRLHALLKLSQRVVLMLTILLGLALLAITGNTIRLQILTQRDEIEVSRLIGATRGFIRRPFLYLGAFQGLAGGLFSWGIVSLGVNILNHSIAPLAALYATAIFLHFPTLGAALVLLLAATGLGWVGAWVAVNRFFHSLED